MLVDVYWNRRLKLFSVRSVLTNKVLFYRTHARLVDARFVVRKGGHKRQLESGQRNVHAFVRGTYQYKAASDDLPGGQRVWYNPNAAAAFLTQIDDEGRIRAVDTADEVLLFRDGEHAKVLARAITLKETTDGTQASAPTAR